jgi:hypothetical protein
MEKRAFVVVLAAPWLLGASTDSAWLEWERLSNERCPTHHVNWVCGSCYLNLIEGFDATLTRSQKRNVDRIADLKRNCAHEEMGFSCEAGYSFDAYKKLGLIPRFVHYGCRTVKCEFAASCSRLPPDP